MAEPEIIWAFLPNGIKDGKLRFSAAVSIRLPEESGPSPNLGLFPEILNWAETVKGLTFDIQFENETTEEAIKVSQEPDQELWQAIFQPDSPVFPFKFADLSKVPVFAFPVKHVQSFIAQQYINMAAESPDEPPPIEKMFRSEALGMIRLKPITSPRFASVVQLRTTRQVIAQRVRATAEKQKVKAIPVSPKPNPSQDFYLLRLYHQPRNKVVVDPKTKKPVVQRVPIAPPELDFHQACSYLANYPALMRLLGLAVDFEIDMPDSVPPTGLVRIVARDRDHRSPWTKYSLNKAKNVFEAAPRSSKPEVVDGFLDLTDEEKFDIVQVDVDGAALKMADLADEAEETDRGDLPALRSSGISVVRTGNAVYLAETFRTAVEHNLAFEKKKQQTFYAEDLVQGYRVDVWDDESKNWHSLCKRVGTYKFLRTGQEVILEDEGFVSESVTQAADDSSEDLYTHESIFGWEGWSLVAPRPGKTIDKEDKAADIQSQAATAFRLETKFKPAAGSLPRLRFGRRYRLRARAVDLAGNGVGPEATEDTKAIPAPAKPAFEYARFDPVPPPVVVPRKEPGRGETADEVVIRSFNDRIDKDKVPTDEIAERHIVPPKTSQLAAEAHGMFDGEGGGLKKDVYGLIMQKDPGELGEIEPAGEIELPYFPDPWAEGVLIRGLPGVPADKPLRIKFSGDWPELKPFRLRVEEGEGPAVWDESDGVLTVYLKKSDVVTIRLSCWFPEPILPKLGLYRWLEKPDMVIPTKILQAPQAIGPLLVVPPGLESAATDRSAAAQKIEVRQPQTLKSRIQVNQEIKPVFQLPRINLNAIKRIAVEGSHWMMTPFRTVTLSHAVQQPLGRPGAATFAAKRGLGQTHVVFDGQLDVHGSSSQKFDLTADWKEPVDILSEKTWRTLDGTAHVLEQALGRGSTSFIMNEGTNHRHEFGDTKYRRVNYTLTETTRFKEQMPADIATSPELLIRKSDPITIDIPNSAPPALPGIAYVVPTFGWERKRELGKFTSIRKGGGLRVYLERPWFSSGEGELLGVVLPPTAGVPMERPFMTYTRTAGAVRMETKVQAQARGQATAAGRTQFKTTAMLTGTTSPPVSEALRPYVTLWGTDPLWRAGTIKTPEYPLPEDFGLAQDILGGLPLVEIPGGPTVTAVGHKVEYDEERAMWFSDIEIDPHDAYFPFVRLALARFQPLSVRGAHLSKVVTADFIQLAPDRTVSVTFNRSNLRQFGVTVSGASYVQASAGSGPGQIEVALEARNIAMPDEIGWAEVPGAKVTLRAQRVAGGQVGNFIWSGKLEIPKGIKLKSYRIAVREYETFVSDEVEEATKTRAMTARAPLKKVRRLVFAETFPLLDL